MRGNAIRILRIQRHRSEREESVVAECRIHLLHVGDLHLQTAGTQYYFPFIPE